MTSTTWDQLHARNAIVRSIIARADAGILPTALWDEIPGIWDHFADEDHVLRALQQRWFTTLTMQIDQEIEVGDGNLTEDVRRAYRNAARALPGVRRVLDTYAGNPVMQVLRRREEAMLRYTAGVQDPEVITSIMDVVVPAPRRLGFLHRIFALAS